MSIRARARAERSLRGAVAFGVALGLGSNAAAGQVPSGESAPAEGAQVSPATPVGEPIGDSGASPTNPATVQEAAGPAPGSATVPPGATTSAAAGEEDEDLSAEEERPLSDEDLSAEEERPLSDEDLSAEEEVAVRGPWAQVYDPSVESPEGVLARAQLRGGAILLGSGGLLLAGAIALGVSDPCARAGGNSCSGASRNRATLTMAVPAAAMLAAGGALLGVGLKHRRELRAAAGASAEGAHVTFYGRF